MDAQKHPGLINVATHVLGQQENIHALQTELKTCSMRRDLHWGRRIHGKAVETHNDSNMYVVTALIKMYAKCGSMVDARLILDSIPKPHMVCWTALVSGYAENGEGLIALDYFSMMKAHGCIPSSVTYVAALKACSSLALNGHDNRKDFCLKWGRQIHSEIDCHWNHFVQTTLVDMYAKCGSMVEARRMFDSIQNPSVACWTAMLMGYAENGEGLMALELFSNMKERGCVLDSVTYVAALRACTSLAVNGDGNGKRECLSRGKAIHSEVGCHMNHYVQNTLVDMYTKCGSMVDARRVFDSIRKPNLVCWTALILGYADNGEELTALELFSRMKASGCVLDSVTYVAAIKACTFLAANGDCSANVGILERGRKIHTEIGCHMDRYVQNSLIDMYANCGSMVEARCVFDSIKKPDVVSWTAVIMGYAENGEGNTALDLFSRMKMHQCAPNSVTYVAVFKACCLTGTLSLGRKFHSEINEFTTLLVTCLVDFYAKCGSMAEAQEVFDSHSRSRDVRTWNALLTGYGRLGDSESVFKHFEKMQDQGFRPVAITTLCLLMCCSHKGLVEKARGYFEAMPVHYGVTPDVQHYNCMVDVLGRAKQLDGAMVVLREMTCNPNAVTWTTLFSACRKWKNVGLGTLAFRSLVNMDKKDASAHVLMAHTYGSWHDEKVEFRALLGEAYVMDGKNKIAKFVIGKERVENDDHRIDQL